MDVSKSRKPIWRERNGKTRCLSVDLLFFFGFHFFFFCTLGKNYWYFLSLFEQAKRLLCQVHWVPFFWQYSFASCSRWRNILDILIIENCKDLNVPANRSKIFSTTLKKRFKSFSSHQPLRTCCTIFSTISPFNRNIWSSIKWRKKKSYSKLWEVLVKRRLHSSRSTFSREKNFFNVLKSIWISTIFGNRNILALSIISAWCRNIFQKLNAGLTK